MFFCLWAAANQMEAGLMGEGLKLLASAEQYMNWGTEL